MGRPLNKKYFGNRNVGSSSVTTDDGIGGQGIASVTLDALGSYTTRPTITFPVPTLPTGVRATGTVTSEALSAVVTVAGTGYEVGELLTVTTAGGSAIAYVASVDTGGEVLTVNFTGTGASRGSFEALPSGAQATVTDGEGNDACTLTITFRAKAVVITEAGSGYIANTDLEVGDLTFTQSVTASAIALTTDSGSAGSATNQENAIVMYANITGAGTNAYPVDIIKQVSSNRYKVTDGTYTGIATLVRDDSPETGRAYIVATDSAGGTYFVMKLTSRKAVLIQNTGTQFADGTSAKWTFGDAVLNTTVKIENA